MPDTDVRVERCQLFGSERGSARKQCEQRGKAHQE
jgi:hypothetical protein